MTLTWIYISKIMAGMLCEECEIFGIDNDGHEGLIESRTDLELFDQFTLEHVQ